MRIQHNIMAMNAYRNYTGNTSALSKNLEKLSSGYKINRAGDDAAGLAISEKMRAQITGLKAAQKNAKDGISLVQTAEGALTEVHSMLNRMVDLADQSANGTFDDTTDRANLQKEVAQLKSEIDRIADATNFNGIKLLDGSLSSTGATSAVSGINTKLSTVDIDATKGKYELDTAITTAMGKDTKISVSIGLSNGKSFDIELTYTGDKKFVDADGNEYGPTGLGASSTKAETQAALVDALKKAGLDKDFEISFSGADKLTLESKTAGTGAPTVTSVGQATTAADGTVSTVAQKLNTTAAADAKIGIASGSFTAFTGANAKTAIFEINGKKFAIIADNTTDVSKLDKDVTVLVGDIGDDTEAASLAQQLTKATGMNVTFDTGTGVGGGKGFVFASGTSNSGKGGLTLQIGDTSDAYNKLTVSVGDMHTKSLGISSIDISTQEGGDAAADLLKAAINSVSGTRGDLGATQNRLEHTINNLSVMTENIQDAEANIRDVDVAEEMMAYTKNNILVQSAQAMLAQANQLPQGVLQLLQ